MNKDVLTQYEEHLQLLRQSAGQDRQNIFIDPAVILLFWEQFELAKRLLQASLIADGNPLAAAATDREIIMDAYEMYLFIDEDLWLQMLEDTQRIQRVERDDALVTRIIGQYMPAFELVLKNVKNDKKFH